MADTDNTTGEVDKEHLYRRYYAGEDRRARIYERGVMQSLDLADDEMNVSTRVVKKGLGAGGVLAIASAIGIPTAVASAAIAYFASQPDAPAPAETPAAADTDTDTGLYLLDQPPTQGL